MKPVLRIASLMEQPVKFIWTHDAFRVGEDGPTHQPIEQEAQLRLLEKLKNHSGKPSFVALRPADSAETVKAWDRLLHTNDRPGVLILSRQNINDITVIQTDRSEESAGLYKGAYIVYETSDDADVILLANGSEVSILTDAAKIIENRTHYRVRVVSAPSEGIFREQTNIISSLSFRTVYVYLV